MLTLYKFVPAWGLPDVSPFCIKLEMYLKMAGVPYETRLGDPRKAPKGKLPYIEHAGTTLADSSHVIDYLKKTLGDPLDAHLTAKERATATAYKSLLEEHLYFVVAYQRWTEDAGWATYLPTMRGVLKTAGAPARLTGFIAGRIRSAAKTAIYAQGMGRHTSAEVDAIGKGLVTSIADTMGDGPFFLGEKPSSIDATLYGFLLALMDAPFVSNVKDHANAQPNLRAYVDRLKAKYWS